MIPVFGCVVAPDDDTQYTGFFDLPSGPVIQAIPPADLSYLVSAVDAYRVTVSSLNVHDADRFSNGTSQTAAAEQACQHRITRGTARRRSERLRPMAPNIIPPADRAGCCEQGGQA